MPPKKSPQAKKKPTAQKKTDDGPISTQKLPGDNNDDQKAKPNNIESNDNNNNEQQNPLQEDNAPAGASSSTTQPPPPSSSSQQQQENEKEEEALLEEDVNNTKSQSKTNDSLKPSQVSSSSSSHAQGMSQRGEKAATATAASCPTTTIFSAISRYVCHQLRENQLQQHSSSLTKQELLSSILQSPEEKQELNNKIFNSLTLKSAAQTKRILGLDSCSVTPCLCSLGFHLVGSGPLFDNDATIISDNNQNNFDLFSNNFNSKGDKNNTNKKTSTSKSRSSKTTRRSRQDDENRHHRHQDEDEVDDDTPSVLPIPPVSWKEEVLMFPQCNHSVCRSCALHYFTLQMAMIKNDSTNDYHSARREITLECSFCVSSSMTCNKDKKPSSSLSLSLPSSSTEDNDNQDNKQHSSSSSLASVIKPLFDSQFIPALSQMQQESPATRSWNILLANALFFAESKFKKAISDFENISMSQKQKILLTSDNNNSSSTGIDSASPSQQQNKICGICEEEQGTCYCYDCGFALCAGCHKANHSKGKFKTHNLVQGLPESTNDASKGIGMNNNNNNNDHDNNRKSRHSVASSNASSSMTASSPTTGGLATSSSMCVLHPMYPIELFCRDCNKTACLMCHFSGEHKNHKVSQLEEVQDQAKKDIVASCNRLRANALTSTSVYTSSLQNRMTSVSGCADAVIDICEQVFSQMENVLAQRKQKFLSRIESWREKAQSVANDDFVILNWVLQYVKNIIDSCGELVEEDNNGNNNKDDDDDQNQQQSSSRSTSTSVFQIVSSDKNTVTADTLSLRDAVRHQVSSLLSSSLIQALHQNQSENIAADEILLRRQEKQNNNEDDDDDDERELIISSSNDDDDDDQQTTSSSKNCRLLLNPVFAVVLTELLESLNKFLSIETDSKLILPEWASFLSMVLQQNEIQFPATFDTGAFIDMAMQEDAKQQQHTNTTANKSEDRVTAKKNNSNTTTTHQKQPPRISGSSTLKKQQQQQQIPDYNQLQQHEEEQQNHNHEETSNQDRAQQELDFEPDHHNHHQNSNNQKQNSSASRRRTNTNQQQEFSPQQQHQQYMNQSMLNTTNGGMMMQLGANNNNSKHGSPGQQQQPQQQPQQQSTAHQQGLYPPQRQQQQQMPINNANTSMMMNNNNNNPQMQQQLQHQQQQYPGVHQPTAQQFRQGLMLPSSLRPATFQQQMNNRRVQQQQNNNNNAQQQQSSKFNLHLGSK